MSFLSSPSSRLTVLCDIGSASVGAGLVLFVEHKKPQILYTVRVPISIKDAPEQEGKESLMIRYLDLAFKTLVNESREKPEVKALSGKRIDIVYAFFSSPWYRSKTHTIQISNEKPAPLKKSELDKRVAEEEKKFEQESIENRQAYLGNADIKMIEREIIKIKLNGYETSNPFLKEVTHAELSLYMSLIPYDILKKVEELSLSYLHTSTVLANTFPLVSFGSIKSTFTHEKDYIILDVAGEHSDVSIVRNGIIERSSSFALGRNTLIRSIAQKMSVSTEIALSFLDMKLQGSLEPSSDIVMESPIVDCINAWNAALQSTLQKISDERPLPEKVFLTADSDLSAFYVRKLKEKKENENALTVIELTTNFFLDKIDFNKFVSADPFIALETVFVASNKM